MAIDILLFMTWKTRHNRRIIDRSMAVDLVRMLPGLALMESATMLELAVVSNHVHTVLRTTVQPDIPAIAQRVKGASARIANLDV